MADRFGIRELAPVVITTDGKRVRLPAPSALPAPDSVKVSLPGILRLIGLGLVALITGSRREPGGTRRDRR